MNLLTSLFSCCSNNPRPQVQPHVDRPVASAARYAPIRPANNSSQPVAKIVVDSTLVQAVAEKNKERVTQLLHFGEDPNRCNLLPRLVMCRIPKDTHVKNEGTIASE